METPNLHALKCHYLGPTGYKSARISIQSLRFRQRIVIPQISDNNWADSIKYLKERGFNIIGQAEYPGKGWLLLSDTFEPLK